MPTPCRAVRISSPNDNSRLYKQAGISPGDTPAEPGPCSSLCPSVPGDPPPLRPAHLQELQPHQLQALPLEPPDDLPDEMPLDPVRFDGHEGALAGPAEGCKEKAEE